MRTRSIVCCALLLLGTAAFGADGPVAKGSLILTGNVYFMSQSGDLYEWNDDALTTLTFTPGFGYFVIPGLMVGANVDFLKQSQGEHSQSLTSFGPMVTYYFGANNGRTEFKGAVYPYLGAFAAFGSFDDGDDGDNPSSTSFGFKGGIVYMMSNAVGLDAGLHYSSDTWSFDDDSESGSTIQIGVGITAFVF